MEMANRSRVIADKKAPAGISPGQGMGRGSFEFADRLTEDRIFVFTELERRFQLGDIVGIALEAAQRAAAEALRGGGEVEVLADVSRVDGGVFGAGCFFHVGDDQDVRRGGHVAGRERAQILGSDLFEAVLLRDVLVRSVGEDRVQREFLTVDRGRGGALLLFAGDAEARPQQIGKLLLRKVFFRVTANAAALVQYGEEPGAAFALRVGQFHDVGGEDGRGEGGGEQYGD